MEVLTELQRTATGTARTVPTADPVETRCASGAAWPLLLILLAGAGVRLALWGWFDGQSPTIWDEKDYDILARNLYRHGEFAFQPGTPATLRPPLYPAAVALTYELFGEGNYQAVRLWQAVLSLFNVILLYRVGLSMFSRSTALWLAALCAFYPSLLGYNNLLLTEVLFTFLLTAFCALIIRGLQRDSIPSLAAAGVVLGLAALTRSVVWLFPPVLGGYLMLGFRGGLGRRSFAVAALVAAFAATIAPWSIRNTTLEKTFVAIDTMGGRNFMMGNYAHTPLYRSWATIGLEGEKSWFHEVQQASSRAERNTQGKVDKVAMRQGLKFIAANPGLTLLRDLVKFFDFWGLERELVAGAQHGYFGPLSNLAIVVLAFFIVASYVFALFAGLFGMIVAPPVDRRVHLFLLLVIAFICGMHTLVFGHSRYHLPVMPLVLIYSASAIGQREKIWQQRFRWPSWAACGLCGIMAAGWAWTTLADGERILDLIHSIV